MTQQEKNNKSLDDLLLASLEPQVEKVKEKFANGEKLIRDDFYLLLLKTQYNHLSHLDIEIEKLNDSYVDLKEEIKDLKRDNEVKFAEVNTKFAEMKAEMNRLISNQTKWFVGAITLIAVIFKLIDIFVK